MHQRIELVVRRHSIVLTATDDRWTATVDGVRIDRWYELCADAWSAAVQASERFDGLAAVERRQLWQGKQLPIR